MKSLVWKELRENLKWIPLPGLVILLVFLIDKPEEPMLDYTASFFFALTAVAFGAALGFVQTFFEGHGDKRSLLMHRPLSPSRILLAKMLAGVCIYMLALGIPFAGLQVWYATPGRMAAPYHWPMSLPWLADILSGLVYYFAGMVVAQRDARWYGSRALPLAAGFFCSYLVWVVPEFWQALLAIVIVGSFMGVAAWGCFSTGGSYPSLPHLAKAALAFTFVGGLLIVSMLAKQRLGEWLDAGIDYEYTIDRQGRVLFQRFKPGVGVIGRATDLEGHEVSDFLPDSPTASAPLVWTETPVFWSYRNSGRFFVKCHNDSVPSQESWYYDQLERRLVGYDSLMHQSLGSFGPGGFTEPDQEPGPAFPEGFRYRSNPRRGLTVEFLAFSSAVYAVDFFERTIQTLFAPPDGERIVFISAWHDPLDKNHKGLVVSMEHSFQFLTKDGKPIVSVPRVHDAQKYRPVLAGPLGNVAPPNRFLVWYQSMMPWTTALEPDEYRNLPGYLHEYDLAGHERSRREIPPPPYLEASYAQALFGLVTPMTEAASLVETSKQLREQERAKGSFQKSLLLFHLEDVKYCIPGTAPDKGMPSGLIPVYIAFMLLSAGASALGCYLLARRYAFSRPRRIGWAVMGLFFGWIGLVLMLAIQEWPARIACPRCRKLRVVTRDHCEHCGSAHARPTPDGTEIFEPSAEEKPALLAAH